MRPDYGENGPDAMLCFTEGEKKKKVKVERKKFGQFVTAAQKGAKLLMFTAIMDAKYALFSMLGAM
jgi:hypothetical protein